MIRSLVRDRRIVAIALSLALLPTVACSRAATRPSTDVEPAHAAADTLRRVIPLAKLRDGSRVRYNTSTRWYGRRVGEVKRVEGDTLWLDIGFFRPDLALP